MLLTRKYKHTRAVFLTLFIDYSKRCICTSIEVKEMVKIVSNVIENLREPNIR